MFSNQTIFELDLKNREETNLLPEFLTDLGIISGLKNIKRLQERQSNCEIFTTTIKAC